MISGYILPATIFCTHQSSKESMDPFWVTFIQGVCFGCKITLHEFLLMICASCIMNGGHLQEAQFSSLSLVMHLHVMCVCLVWPQFHPQTHLIIPHEIISALLESHKGILGTLGVTNIYVIINKTMNDLATCY